MAKDARNVSRTNIRLCKGGSGGHKIMQWIGIWIESVREHTKQALIVGRDVVEIGSWVIGWKGLV